MKETIVSQQLKLSKLDHQGHSGLANLPVVAAIVETADCRQPDNSTAQITAAKESADKEANEKKRTSSKFPSGWGSTVERNNDRWRKTSSLSQNGQKIGLTGDWDPGSSDKKDEFSGPPPIITSSVPGGIFDGAGNFDFFAEQDTPLMKEGMNGINTSSDISEVAAPLETVDVDKIAISGGLGLNCMSRRVSISLEDERFTDAEQIPSPGPAHTALPTPEVLSNSTSGFLKTLWCAEEEAPTTPKPWPAPSLTTAQPQVFTPAPTPANPKPEKPVSLWERKKRKAPTQPAPALNLFGGDDAKVTSGVWGDGWGGGREGRQRG